MNALTYKKIADRDRAPLNTYIYGQPRTKWIIYQGSPRLTEASLGSQVSLLRV